MIGNIEAINKAITVFNDNGLLFKVIERLQDYLSCEVKFLRMKKGMVRTAPSHQEPDQKVLRPY